MGRFHPPSAVEPTSFTLSTEGRLALGNPVASRITTSLQRKIRNGQRSTKVRAGVQVRDAPRPQQAPPGKPPLAVVVVGRAAKAAVEVEVEENAETTSTSSNMWDE